MQQADPLAQLRGIHLPDPVGGWPPGPGWWLLAALLLLLIFGLAFWLLRRHRANAWRREALSAIDQTYESWQRDRDPLQFLQASTAILKRAALRQFPNYDVARLSGGDWDAFLDRQWHKRPDTDFSSLGLAERAYQPELELQDPEQFRLLCRRWLKQLAQAPC